METWSPIRESVIVPSDVGEDTGLNRALDAFLTSVGVGDGRRSTYANAFTAIGRTLGYGKCPENLRALMDAAGFTERTSVYGGFSGTRPQKAKADTARERRQVVRTMVELKPRFMLVDVVAAPRRGGRILKASLATQSGLLPMRMAREERDVNLLSALWTESIGASLAVPIVTMTRDAGSLDAALGGMAQLSVDHFALVNRFYRPQSNGVVLEWNASADADRDLSFADILHRIGHPPDKSFRNTFVSVGRAQYLACGETSSGRFYLQRFVGSRAVTAALMLARVRAFEQHFRNAAEPCLDAWPVESMHMAPKASFGYGRLAHAIVMSSLFTLHRGAANPTVVGPAWRRLHDDWPDNPLRKAL